MTISLIIHTLVFILATQIVFPPVDQSDSAYSKLDLLLQEVKPVVKETKSFRAKSEPQGEIKPKEQLPPPQSLEPPAEIVFRLPVVKDHARASPAKVSFAPPVEKPIYGMPSLTSIHPKRAVQPIDKAIALLPGLNHEEGDTVGGSLSDSFHGLRIGPLSAHAIDREQSSYYVNALLTTNPRSASQFADIFSGLALGILEQAAKRKLDIVFVIDTTGSMEDNVRGVKDYIHCLLRPLEEKGLDVALGLVEFSDQEVKKAKVVGLTDDPKKFKRWLDKTKFYGGRDIPESGYEALLTALEKIKFRDSSQRSFILISDAPQHDLDYDGKSSYTLDEMVAMLNKAGVSIFVVGADCLPMKQLAWGTGGQWKHIPGGNPFFDLPEPIDSGIQSSLGSSPQALVLEDKVTVELKDPVPDWVELSYKILSPKGLKVLGPLTYRKEVIDRDKKSIEFSLRIDLSEFKDDPGIYTLIYKTRDSLGRQDLLRRTFELQKGS